MTPAIRLLKKMGIDFKTIEYIPVKDYNHNLGENAAKSMNIPLKKVFKTIILKSEESQKHITALIPVNHTLNLKKIAKSMGLKKISLMDLKNAENYTGYIRGAISPIAQKKKSIFIIDNSSLNFFKIYISGGKRGLEIEMDVSSLIKLCNMQVTSIIDM
jgi:Cys-tRNA(Pro)/Cys-tRNA(Cys) deacylase